MRGKGHSHNMFLRIMASPLRVLGKARDMYVRSITNCGQHMSYGYHGDAAVGFSSLPRSYSVASSRSEDSDDFAELMRVASARTLANRIDMDLVLKQQAPATNSKGLPLPKSSSVGMASIDEDKPYDLGEVGVVAVVPGSYPRSRSYAVAKRSVVF